MQGRQRIPERFRRNRFLRFLANPPLVYSAGRKARIRRFLASLPEGPVLNAGAQREVLGLQVINLDIALLPGVGLVGDAHRLPVESGSLAGVVCTGVLEHVADERQVVAELVRCLKPGGRIYVETPFLQGYHPDPMDRRRFTLEGLRALLCGTNIPVRADTAGQDRPWHTLSAFEEVEAGVSHGPASAWVWVTSELLASPFGWYPLQVAVRSLVGWALSPVRFLDALLLRRPHAHRAASGFYFIGVKPSA